MLKVIWGFLHKIRKFLAIVLGIGLPVWIYLAFIAREPFLDAEYDVMLGRQVVASIAADTVEYPILPKEEYPEVYAYVQSIADKVVSSPEVRYHQLFKYDSILVINRDDVLNAFCTPGGYIFVYTGILRYMEREDHLAGVLGHEIAHAELRHSAHSMQREFGRQRLVEFAILANPVSLGDVVAISMMNKLVGSKYTRDQEADADTYSVRYLQSSDYACNGAAAFFDKMLEEGDNVNIPEFLSDHPDSRARVRDINAEAQRLDCSTSPMDDAAWLAFQAKLPKADTAEVE